jgi:hypothetical protein
MDPIGQVHGIDPTFLWHLVVYIEIHRGDCKEMGRGEGVRPWRKYGATVRM